MLTSLRRPAVSLLRHPRRGLATDEANETVLRNTLGMVGRLVGTEAPSMSSSPPPAPTRLVNPTPSSINIPPAEDSLLHFLTSMLQKHGKRQRAVKITSGTLMYIHTLTRAPPLPILRKAITSVAPAVRCISNKHAGKVVVYPVTLSERQRTRIAIEWILEAAKKRGGQRKEEKLAREIIAIIRGLSAPNPQEFSPALKKKEEVHKYAMMNRGNAQKA